MNTGWKILLGIGVVALFIVMWFMGTYNSLVSADEGVNEKWANVEAAYQYRFDLIQNLVNTVQGSADFEQETLTAVTEARSAWASAQGSDDPSKFENAGNAFDSAISRLLVTVEAYPDIKSTEAFLKLQDELSGTESRIKLAREEYNKEVKGYNTKVRVFPNNIIAGMFGFEKRDPFSSADGADKATDVEFSFGNS